MKHIILSVLTAIILTAVALVTLTTLGKPDVVVAASLEQEGEPITSALQVQIHRSIPLSITVELTAETTGTQTATLPFLLDVETLLTLTDSEVISAQLLALIEAVASEGPTTTVEIGPMLAPSVTIQVITPTVATTQTLAVTTTVPSTVAQTITDTPAITTETPISPAQTLTATTVTTPTGSYVSQPANVRAGPGLDFDIVDFAQPLQPITLTARNADGSWYQLENGNWIAAFLVENAPVSLPIRVNETTVISDAVSATVLVPTLILRAGPSTLENSLGSFAEGTVVIVRGKAAGDEWVNVTTPDGQTGWMFADFLELGLPIGNLPEISFTSNISVTGQIVDDAGEPIAGINIAVTQQTADLQTERVDAISDEEGEFFAFLPNNSTGTWQAEVVGIECTSRIMDNNCLLEGYYELSTQQDVTVPLTEPLEFAFATATVIITGTVLDSEDTPAGEGLRVVAERDDGARSYTETTADGVFVLPAGVGVWELYVQGGDRVTVEVIEEETPAPIDLPAPAATNV